MLIIPFRNLKAASPPLKMKVILIALCLVAVNLRASEALSCLPCDEARCSPPSGCKWGTQRDVCGCCQKCSPGEGEPCEGPWNMFGSCAEGLTCRSGPYDQGYCVDERANEILRQKRSLASRRRAGLSQRTAKVHRRQDYGGVPEHIKRLLRAQGVAI